MIDPNQNVEKLKLEDRTESVSFACDKVLNQDNRKCHHESKHKGQTPSFRTLAEANQILLNFGVMHDDNANGEVRLNNPKFQIRVCN